MASLHLRRGDKNSPPCRDRPGLKPESLHHQLGEQPSVSDADPGDWQNAAKQSVATDDTALDSGDDDAGAADEADAVADALEDAFLDENEDLEGIHFDFGNRCAP